MDLNLTRSNIILRRQEQQGMLLRQQALIAGHPRYRISCPCHLETCEHENHIPVLFLSRCLRPGELDFFQVTDPFLNQHGFTVNWVCMECELQYCCGIDREMRIAHNL